MLLSVAELQPVLHELFTTTADSLAKQTEFCQRSRKLTGSVFARTLVFGLLENPDATLDDLADFALSHLQVDASAQAFDQRFTPTAVVFLHELLREAFQGEPAHFAQEIATLGVMLNRRCRIEHRHDKPSTFDRLAALDAEFREMVLAA